MWRRLTAPGNSPAMDSIPVLSRARRTSRFLTTLKSAPASWMERRRSVASATVRPLWRVTMTISALSSTLSSSLTISSFLDRSKGLLRQIGTPGTIPSNRFGTCPHLRVEDAGVGGPAPESLLAPAACLDEVRRNRLVSRLMPAATWPIGSPGGYRQSRTGVQHAGACRRAAGATRFLEAVRRPQGFVY